MFGVERYIPESVKRMFRREAPTPSQEAETETPEAEPLVDVTDEEAEANPDAYVVSAYLRSMPDGTERQVRLLRTKSREKNGETREAFLVQADIGEDAEGNPAFVTVGDRTANIDPAQRKIEFETMNIHEEYQGQKLATDAYKAMADYLVSRTAEIDPSGAQKPWRVEMYPMSEATKHLFERMFNAHEEGMDMVGTLRSSREIEMDERREIDRRQTAQRLTEVRAKIDQLTAAKDESETEEGYKKAA